MNSVSKIIRHVSPEAFLDVFPIRWKPVGTKTKYGLAISGGVDSMALAFLCSQLQSKFPNHFEFEAFVVDHKVRNGSDKEARAVAQLLKTFNIPTKILPIEWPDVGAVKKASNFESLARTYRFQALGMACRESGIQTLCLAHHQDDQYETVIMRLINGDRGFGLAGISASGGLPECYGKYGISESGSPYPWHNIQEPDQDSGAGKGLKIEAREGFSNPNDIDYAHQLRDWPNRYPSLPFESGGINVLRPLLSFTKEELRLTCLNYGVTWFEDQTNTDPTLTKRNAIRHVYQNATMPVALQKPSILSFAERWRARQGDLDRAIEEYSSLIVDIKSFNNRTGILKVRFNSLHAVSSKWSKSLVSSMPGFEDKLVLSTLRAVIEVVSPLEHIPLPSLSRTAKMLFPSLDQSLPAEDRPALPASFTVGCVQFEREQKSNPSKSPIWSIRRQNTMKSESAHTRLSIGTPSKVEVEWKLFDGRYWIGIQYYDKGQNIYVRFLQKEDLGKYKASLPPKTKLTFNRIMKDFAPGYTKFTLPAIVEATADGKEHVIALPTLNCHLPGLADQLRYSVRYKKIRSKWIFDKLRAGGPASPSSYALPTRPSEKWDELSHGGFL